MRVVEIRRRRPEDAEIERLARVLVRTPGMPAEVEILMPEFAEGLGMMLADGVTDEHGAFLRLDDGERFLDALPSFYRSSRFWAEPVEDDS
jgi:hypothetical protein